MPRIRTIKPEFPQSESMGKISRDARLLFVQLWTICDDSGRARGNSRMLASLLYPYDDDAKGLIDGWLAELEGVSAVRRYLVDGETYLEVCNWLKHQKIDRPSASRFPQFDESSRIVASPRETSCLDLGPRTKEGTKEGKGSTTAAARPAHEAEPPEFSEVMALYPRRSGGDPRRRALRAARARLADGSTWAELRAGAERYAAFIRSTGKEGTEYVMQSATFFGPDERYREAWSAPLTRADQRLGSNLSAAEEFMRRTEAA